MTKKIIGSLAAAIGLSGAFAFNTPSKFQTSYHLNTGSETFVAQGTTAADQNLSHYSTVSATFACNTPTTPVCTYIVSGGVIKQNTPGTYQN